MRLALFLFIFFALFSSQITAQPVDSSKVPVIYIGDMGFSGGEATVIKPDLTIAEFKKFSQPTAFANDDLSGFFPLKDFGFSVNAVCSAIISLKIRNPRGSGYRDHSGLQFTMTYFPDVEFSELLYKNILSNEDTVTSGQNGQPLLEKNYKIDYYTLKYTCKQLWIEAFYKISTDSRKRWCFYSGLGLSGGITFKAETSISYSENMYTKSYDAANGVFLGSSNNPTLILRNEHYHNISSVAESVFIPIGVAYKLSGKLDNWWNKIQLLYEWKAGWYLNQVSKVGMLNTIFNQNQIGVKYEFN